MYFIDQIDMKLYKDSRGNDGYADSNLAILYQAILLLLGSTPLRPI
jgi:hypothetical protein